MSVLKDWREGKGGKGGKGGLERLFVHTHFRGDLSIYSERSMHDVFTLSAFGGFVVFLVHG